MCKYKNHVLLLKLLSTYIFSYIRWSYPILPFFHFYCTSVTCCCQLPLLPHEEFTSHHLFMGEEIDVNHSWSVREYYTKGYQNSNNLIKIIYHVFSCKPKRILILLITCFSVGLSRTYPSRQSCLMVQCWILQYTIRCAPRP